MRKKKMNQFLSVLLTLVMIIAMMPTTVFAETHVHDVFCGYVAASDCNHTHDDDCGYAETVEGVDCGHAHDNTCGYSAGTSGSDCNHTHESCGYAEAVPGTPCTHDCASGGCTLNEDGVTYTCTHTVHDGCGYSEGTSASACTHTEHIDCGYVAAVLGTACNHTHDDACGYIEAVTGANCTHTCIDGGTCGYTAGSPCTYVEPPEHIHSFASTWTVNADGHWHTCIGGDGNCAEMGSYSAHDWGEYYTYSCNICWYFKDHTHTGGEATCSTRADCDLCGSFYGDLDPTNHSNCIYTKNDANTHKVTCGCDTLIAESEDHDFTHWFDNGDGREIRICNWCCYEEFRIIEHTHDWEWTYDDVTHWQKCSDQDCGESSTAAQMHQFDNDTDEICDICGYSRHTHSFSNATCITPATCNCGVSTGNTDPTNHLSGIYTSNDANTHKVTCSDCGTLIVKSESHKFTDWYDIKDGRQTRNCNQCNYEEFRTIEHVHDWGWAYDNEMHWRKCNNPNCDESSTAAQMHQYNYTVTACEICGYSSVIMPTVTITTESMGMAMVGKSYSQSFSYSGEISGMVFWNANGLPTGLSINIGTGVVSGTPAKAGAYEVTISMGATGGGSASKTFKLIVESDLTITTESVEKAIVGKSYSQSFSYSGEASGVVFWNANGLPTGLSINVNNGVVSGTPVEAGTYEVTISIGATGGGSASKTFKLIVEEPVHEHSYSVNSDDNYHWEKCVCGEEKNKAAHNYSINSDDNYHWEECSCGEEKNKAAHNYSVNSDDNYHWEKCACGKEKNKAAHSYSANSDDNYHWIECVCGKEQNKAAHSYFTEYDDNHHWEKCTCGDIKGISGHDYKWKYNNVKHWKACKDCGYEYTEEIMTHSLTKFTPGKDNYHNAQCTGCEYIIIQNCTFNTYVGNTAGHWLVCDFCGKVHSDGVVYDHIDIIFDEKCDVCGEDMAHTEHSYDRAFDYGLYHTAECACGSKINGIHIDDNKDGKCDICKADVNQDKLISEWSVEYCPADKNVGVGNISVGDYRVTGEDTDKIFSGANRNGALIYFPEETRLGDTNFDAGKAYIYSIILSQNINISGANGVVTLRTGLGSVDDENGNYISAHLKADGTVQYANAVRDGDTVVAKMYVNETSPFIIFAITEQPDMVITRSEFIQLLWELDGSSETEYQAQFTDVPQDAVYAMSVNWAVENGLLDIWGEEFFNPDAVLTREQLAVILHGYAVYRNVDVSVGENTNILSFEDAFEISEEAIPAIQWMCGAGLMQDENGYILPHAELMRSEAWEMVSALK